MSKENDYLLDPRIVADLDAKKIIQKGIKQLALGTFLYAFPMCSSYVRIQVLQRIATFFAIFWTKPRIARAYTT